MTFWLIFLHSFTILSFSSFCLFSIGKPICINACVDNRPFAGTESSIDLWKCCFSSQLSCTNLWCWLQKTLLFHGLVLHALKTGHYQNNEFVWGGEGLDQTRRSEQSDSAILSYMCKRDFFLISQSISCHGWSILHCWNAMFVVMKEWIKWTHERFATIDDDDNCICEKHIVRMQEFL